MKKEWTSVTGHIWVIYNTITETIHPQLYMTRDIARRALKEFSYYEDTGCIVTKLKGKILI